MSGLFLPGELVPQAVPSLAAAKGWIYGYVRTDHPGYRSLTVAGVPYRVTSDTYRFDALITQIATDVAALSIAIDPSGPVFGSLTGTLAFPDRLGWLLGLGADGDAINTGWSSPFLSPAAIPLMGISWSEVRIEREKEAIVDAARRQGGYVFGGARLWTCNAEMHRWAYEALAQRWCLRGQVTLLAASSTPMSASVSDGALTGYSLGLAGPPEWDNAQRLSCKATLLVAGTTT